MPVNQTLASFSDTAFITTFLIYLLALVISIFHYVGRSGILDVRRERERMAEQELVSVTAAGGVAGSAGDGGAGRQLPDEDEMDRRSARADKLAGMAQSLVWLGVIVHLVTIVLRGLATSRFPFGNLYEYILVITGCAMVGSAILFQRREWQSMWPWTLAPMLALLFYGGGKLYSDAAPVVPALQSYWFPIHVSTVSIGGAIGMISGIASLLYLLRMWQPKGEERGFFGAVARPLPAAKTLDGVAYKTAIIALPVFGLGVVLGAIWAEAAWGRFWGWDPKETMSFVTWILYAAYLHARATAGWRDSKAAWINVLAFAAMVFNLFFINIVISGLHSYAGLN